MAKQRSSEPRRAGAEVEFGAHYFRHDCGTPYERNDHWLEFFGRIADGIARDLEPTSVLDAGCAMGFLVEALRKRDVEAWGIDISEYAISQAHESVRDHCRVASITEPLPRRYDLIVCIEVLEHLSPEETDAAIANLCANTDRLLISSSPTDYGEATHRNVRPPEAWSALLAREGFLRDLEADVSYVTPWAVLYRRSDEALPETVRRYERSWWQLRSEAEELRRSVLAAQERLAALEAAEEEGRPELQRELDAREEELLRLRDLLIVKDTELGYARGGLAELAEYHARLALLAKTMQNRVPGLLRGLLNRVAAIVARLRRRG
jgi:SAM-dependent methyltransferase